MQQKQVLILCWLLTGLTFWGGCTLDEPASGDHTPALELRSSQNLSVISLHWDPVRVTGFKEYILLQSNQFIPNAPEPEVNVNVSVVKRIDNANITTSAAPIHVGSSQVCYKLYCSVDDRFLYSPTICLNTEVESFAGFNDRGIGIPEFDQMVFFDRVHDCMTLYNYSTGELVVKQTNTTLNFPTLHYSTYEGSSYIFAVDQNQSQLQQYSFPALSLVQTVSQSTVIWATTSYKNLLLVSVEDFQGKNFRILNRQNLANIRSTTGLSGNQAIAVFDGDPAIVFLVGSGQSNKITINAAGQILSEETLGMTIPQFDQQSNVAQGQNLFISGRSGTILDRNGNILGTLVNGSSTIAMLSRLSPDEKEAICLINENGIQRLLISDITQLPTMTTKHMYDLPALTFSEIVVEEDKILVAGTTFDTGEGTTHLIQIAR